LLADRIPESGIQPFEPKRYSEMFKKVPQRVGWVANPTKPANRKKRWVCNPTCAAESGIQSFEPKR
jgi:hypothetical protein